MPQFTPAEQDRITELQQQREWARQEQQQYLRHQSDALRQKAALNLAQDKVRGKYAPQMDAIEKRQQEGRNLTPAMQRAMRGKLAADRIRKKRLKEIEEEEKALKAGKIKNDYPVPIGYTSYAAFFLIACVQDFWAVLDFLTIGWLLNYAMLPFTWLCYWYLIIRRAPISLKRKLWMRTAMLAGVISIIPFISNLPEWIGTAVAVFVVIKLRYEKGKSTAMPVVSAVTKQL